MVHSGGRGLAFGIATVLAATQLRDRTSFVESFAAPLQNLVPRAPEHGVARGRSSSSSSGSEAILAASIFIAAASRHPRIRGTARHAEDGSDARSKDKSHRKNTEKAMTDEVVEDMDRQMVDCAEAGDYEGAAAFRDKLCSAQLDDEASVLQANVEFYAAFSQRDFERIKACWLPSAAVQCIHPYDKTSFILNGLSEISESFKRVFEESKTKNRLVPEEVKVNLRGATAVVTCQEKIVNNKKVQSTLLATHVFRRGPRGKWLLLHRHASKPPGEWSMINSEENGVAWNARLQQLMRAAQTLGPGNAQLIVNTANPFDEDEEGDGPFGLTGVVTAHDDDEDSSDSDDDEPGELYVEDDDELMMEETRDVWKALRKLVIEGWITSEEKIEILADMLEHPGESMVEKAHRLLCTNLGDDERRTAWEDFGELIALQVKKLKSKASKE